MNPAQDERSRLLQYGQRSRHKFARGRKDDSGIQTLRRSVISASNPFGAKLTRKLLMFCLTRAHHHPDSPMTGNLNAHVAGRAKAINSQRVAFLQICQTESAKTYDAGAEQRRRVNITEAFRNRINKCFRRYDVFSIPAIDRPAGELSFLAEILLAAGAVFTSSVCAMQPRYSHPSAHSVLPCFLAAPGNRPNHLVAGDHAGQSRSQLTLDNVQVCPAYATDVDFYQDLIVARLRR